MAQIALPPTLAQAHQDYMSYLDLRRAGRDREGRPRLERAAAAGHPGALYSLAVIEFEGPARDVPGAIAKLSSAASQGHSAARQMLAVLKAKGAGGTPDWRGAVGLVIDGARAGDASALRDLGMILEMAHPGHPAAAQLLFNAACADDVLAVVAIVGRALGGTFPAQSDDLAFWTNALRRVKHPRAHTLPQLGEGARRAGAVSLADGSWNELRQLLAEPPTTNVTSRQISQSPRIFEIKALMSAEECDFLIGLSAPLLKEAKVFNNFTGKLEVDPFRTALEGSLWPSNLTLAAHCLNERMAAAAEAPCAHGETTNILMYRPGDEFRQHYDFFANVEHVPDFAASGQRAKTLLVYLNDDYSGGQTHFLASDLKYRGGVGDAVLFINTDATGRPDHATLHAGLPVERGVKWLVSKWYRERAYWC